MDEEGIKREVPYVCKNMKKEADWRRMNAYQDFSQVYVSAGSLISLNPS